MSEKRELILTEEELEIIGAHRYQREHPVKNWGKIAIVCYAVGISAAFLLFKFVPGYLYALGLLPVFIPSFLTAQLGNKAQKAGRDFAEAKLSS